MNRQLVSVDFRRVTLLCVLGALLALEQPLPVCAAVGRTVGSFSVSDTGAATYSIPIVVPPGAAGLQPKLAITYDSRSENGPLGVGWTLSGFSVIQRCKSTLAQDSSNDQLSFQATDRYCMDGRKLRLTSGSYGQAGSTYQTEVDEFSRITAVGTSPHGPDHFLVQGRDGLTYQYGNTGESRDDPTSPSIWTADKVTDRAGNYMTIQWAASGSTFENWFRPLSIQYTNNDSTGTGGNSLVNFVWEVRPTNDILTSTRVNGLNSLRSNSRLQEIDVFDGSLVRAYKLVYNTSGPNGRSRLASVQECDVGGSCLGATQIGWQNGQAGFGANQSVANLGPLAGFALPVDINGDGRTDVVYPSGSNWAYMLANSSGGYDAPVVTTTPHNGKYANALAIDYFANGITEILVPDASNNWSLLQFTGSGFSSTTLKPGGAAIPASTQAWVGDVNGDGYPDLVYLSANSTQLLGRFNSAQGFSPTVTTLYTAPNGTTIYLYTTTQSFNTQMTLNQGDFNGDGRTDLLIGSVAGGPKILLSTGTSYVASPYVFSDTTSLSIVGTTWRPIDANNDGIDDIAFVDSSGVWKVLYGYPASGAGRFGIAVPSSISSPAIAGGTAVLPVDYDGDGRVDILAAQTTQGSVPGSNWFFLRATGDTFSTAQGGNGSFSGTVATDTGILTSQAQTTLADVNGDGLPDIVYPDSSNNWHVILHNGPAPDLVNNITDGWGNSTQITYAPLTDATVYTKGTGATYPLEDLPFPIQVVKQVTQSDGISGSYSVTESYTGARFDLSGRGFVGFATRTETDSRNGLSTQRSYHQDFPLTGLVGQVTLQQPSSGPVITQVTNSWTPVTLDGTANNQRYFASLTGTTGQSYEVGGPKNGQLVRTTSTTYAYDGYGNATSITAKATDNDGTSPYSGQSWTNTTVNTPDVDVTNWCLPLSTQQQVTYTASSGSPAIMRTKQFTPDTVKCRYNQIVTEPSSSTFRVQEDLLYDGFGNVSSRKVTGVNMTARITLTDWGPAGRLPMKVTDASNAITQYNYNFAFGKISSKTDPNGLPTSWLYDTFGRKTQETRPDGTSTTWSYADCGPYNICNARTRTLVFYTELDKNSATIRGGDIQVDSFDRDYRVWTKTRNASASVLYSMVETDYDSLGRVARKSFPCLTANCDSASMYFTSASYDALNRPTQVSRPASAANSAAAPAIYQYAGDTTTITDANNHAKALVRDANGWMRQIQDATGYTITLGYDSAGSSNSITDSLGNTLGGATYQYGIQPMRVAMNDADLGSWSYTYDALGELTAWTDAKSQHSSAAYDAISRMTDRYEPDLYTHWTWGTSAAAHEVGQLHGVCTGTGSNPTACSASGYSESETYDSVGHRSQRAIQIPGDTTYTYSWVYNTTTGLLDTLTYPADASGYRLTLKYAYVYGLLQSVTDTSDTPNVALWTANADNERGQLTQETFGNGVVVNHNFDAVTGLPIGITAGVGGGAGLQNNAYLFDAVGNLIQRQDNKAGTTENVYYDSLNRLDHTVGDTNTHLTYDSMGRLSTWAAYGNSTNVKDYTTPQAGCTYYPNLQPHAVRRNTQGSWPPGSWCYDANGNATKDIVSGSAVYSVTWTSYNQPLLISGGQSSSQFFYDYNHQRFKQVASYSGSPETTEYIGGLLEKMANSTVTAYRYYVPAGNNTVVYNRRSSGANAIYYLTQDHLGSTALITDPSGALVVNEKFAALGWNENSSTEQTAMANVSRHEFTGQEGLDNAGIWQVNMNGRIYNPSGTMFLSPDPFVQDPTDTRSYNRYSYVQYNPLTLTDPSGFFSLGDLLNPFSDDNPLNPFGHVGRAITLLPYTSFQFSRRFGEDLLRRNSWLQPIAEVAACYWGGPWGCSAASAALTRINGGSVFQSLEAGFVTFATYGAQADTGNWFTDALTNGYVAGVSAGVLGGDPVRSFEFGFAGSVSLSGYEYFTGGNAPSFGPGEDRTPTLNKADCGLPGTSCYLPDANGHVPGDYLNVNLFGYNDASAGCFAQSQLCSRIFDKVPGLQGVSLLHDNFVLRGWANFPTMLPAAVLTYASFVGEYSTPLLSTHPYYDPRAYQQ
jgi:RHS repeat-associated protein